MMKIEGFNSHSFNPLREMNELENKLRESVQDLQREQREFHRKMLEASESIAKSLRLPNFEVIEPIIQKLSLYGWYINYSFDMQELGKAGALAHQGRTEELDKHMEKILIAEWPHIRKGILHNHPSRIGPLEQAMDAHENGLYYLSIPVFLAQVDGICKEFMGHQFFISRQVSRQEYEPLLKQWAEQQVGIHRFICAALITKGAFQLHFTEPNMIAFTRHSILHGEYNEYGTKINSLKAMSLLMYINEIVSRQ